MGAMLRYLFPGHIGAVIRRRGSELRTAACEAVFSFVPVRTPVPVPVREAYPGPRRPVDGRDR